MPNEKERGSGGGAAAKKKANADIGFDYEGNRYQLRFSIKAMAFLQDYFGLKSLTEVGERLSDMDTIGLNEMVAIFHAGLQTHHSDMTRDDVVTMLDDIGLEAFMALAGDAFAGASVASSGGDGNDAPDPPPGQ